jgi:hypothetical protein
LQWSVGSRPLYQDKLSHLWTENFMSGYVDQSLE